MLSYRLTAVVFLSAAVILAACEPVPAPPTLPPNGTPATIATKLPDATVGPLNQTEIPSLGLTMLTPSTWKAPVSLNETTLIISPAGSTDTSASAGPFMLIGDAQKIVRSRLNFSFDPAVTDPRKQLDAL